MTQSALQDSFTHRPPDVAMLGRRLDQLAHEMEEAGLPWAAAGIRDVAALIAAESRLADRLAA